MVAKYASIIGDEFNLDVLLSILPKKSHEKKFLVKALDTLSQGGLVVNISASPPVYAFRNELIRNTLYDLVLPR